MEISGGLFGTILAALIAAAISLTGILISKDQKTTEFRQVWIDQLRDDVAKFISYISFYAYQIRVTDPNKENSEEFQRSILKDTGAEIIEMERIYAAILLRLNPKEHMHIVKKLDEIKALYTTDAVLHASIMDEHESELIGLFQVELKKEWKRVKSGEVGFRIAKYVSVILLICGVLVLSGTIELPANKQFQTEATKVAPLN